MNLWDVIFWFFSLAAAITLILFRLYRAAVAIAERPASERRAPSAEAVEAIRFAILGGVDLAPHGEHEAHDDADDDDNLDTDDAPERGGERRTNANERRPDAVRSVNDESEYVREVVAFLTALHNLPRTTDGAIEALVRIGWNTTQIRGVLSGTAQTIGEKVKATRERLSNGDDDAPGAALVAEAVEASTEPPLKIVDGASGPTRRYELAREPLRTA